ncbi:MAG TPA: hypothetical protein VJQ79_12025 [Acidimicrobiia bacterium]|nr:hypothetical protein [Acidimicrobiia bacterium]
MTEREEGQLLDSTRPLISAVNDSVVGHARHIAELTTRLRDPNDDVDAGQELGRFWNRALRDGARLFEATWTMLELLAWPRAKVPNTTPRPEQPPASNPRSARIGPVPSTGNVVAQGLRRRGEAQVTIAANRVRVVRDRADPTRLDLQIEAGGCPRGLYEGTLTIGLAAAAAPVSYNIYVDF